MTTFKVREDLAQNYEDYYQDADSTWRELGAADKSQNILELCARLPHETILEIGAGDGRILQKLSALNFGKQLFALEIASSAVERIEKLGIPNLAECQLFDGYSIPYPDDAFDLVILSHVIEHAEYPRKLIYEASRVAKSVYIEVPLEDTARLKKDFTFTKTGHINAYSPKTIRRLVQSCSLNILEQEITNPSIEVLKFRYGRRGAVQFILREIMLRLFPRIASRLFTYHLGLTCTKN